MIFKGLRVGFALTGSYCTFSQVLPEMKKIASYGAILTPIMSNNAASTDTRFGTSRGFKDQIKEICGVDVIDSIKDAEPIGPKKLIDILVVAPCTGNTLSKLANGITDSSVTMAVKAHLRNNRPVVIAVSSNDALSTSAKNLGTLLNCKNIYFVPLRQDDFEGKPTSLVADMTQIVNTIENAMNGIQLQPLIIT